MVESGSRGGVRCWTQSWIIEIVNTKTIETDKRCVVGGATLTLVPLGFSEISKWGLSKKVDWNKIFKTKLQ